MMSNLTSSTSQKEPSLKLPEAGKMSPLHKRGKTVFLVIAFMGGTGAATLAAISLFKHPMLGQYNTAFSSAGVVSGTLVDVAVIVIIIKMSSLEKTSTPLPPISPSPQLLTDTSSNLSPTGTPTQTSPPEETISYPRSLLDNAIDLKEDPKSMMNSPEIPTLYYYESNLYIVGKVDDQNLCSYLVNKEPYNCDEPTPYVCTTDCGMYPYEVFTSDFQSIKCAGVNEAFQAMNDALAS